MAIIISLATDVGLGAPCLGRVLEENNQRSLEVIKSFWATSPTVGAACHVWLIVL